MAFSSGVHGLTTAAEVAVSHHAVLASHAQLDTMMLFGCVSAVATGISYIFRSRSQAAMLTFAASLLATGVYGFIEGAWPLGVLQTAWAIETARRGMLSSNLRRRKKPAFSPDLAGRQARYREVYGSN